MHQSKPEVHLFSDTTNFGLGPILPQAPLYLPIHWVLNRSNFYILNEDLRVIKTHPPGTSLETGLSEKLVASDKAIRHFRQAWTGNKKDL